MPENLQYLKILRNPRSQDSLKNLRPIRFWAFRLTLAAFRTLPWRSFIIARGSQLLAGTSFHKALQNLRKQGLRYDFALGEDPEHLRP